MHTITRIRFILLIISVFLTAPVVAQQTGVNVEGDVERPFKLDAGSFASMKRITQSVTDRDGKTHTYSGVSLYDIITKAGAVPNNQLKGKALAKYVLVTAADQYQIVLALAEFDPAFTDKVILLADQEDGESLPANLGPYRLIVPGEKKPARSAMRVIAITVQTAKRNI